MPPRRLPAGPLLLGLLLAPFPARAQDHALLQPTDPLHGAVDRLAAWGLVDTLFVGQRPYSRLQGARLVHQALRNRGRLHGMPALAATADGLLERLSARLAPELAGLEGGRGGAHPRVAVSGARLDATWTDSPTRRVPSNDVVRTEARINPLLAYDQGRATIEGATVGLEVEGRLRLGDAAVVALRPRVQGAWGGGGTPDAHDVALREAYLRAVVGNAALTVGRAHVVWGQGLHGGLLLSHNPRALTQVALATARPVRLPWIFGALGPSRHQVFVADLGVEGRRHPHALLVNLRSSFQPHPRVEVGVGFLNQQGGEGAPGATLLERIADVLVVPDLLTRDDYRFSQKMAMADVRLRFPGARGLEVWVEGVVDDFDLARVGSMLWEDGGWVVGARLARVDDAGHVSLAVEGQHTGVRFYGHLDFSGGVTLDRRILGSELGMDGNGLYTRLVWDPGGGDALTLDAAWERRSNDRYRLVERPPDLVRTAILPKEERWRAVLGWERRMAGRGLWVVRTQAGYELTRRFAFRPADTRHSALARVSVEATAPW